MIDYSDIIRRTLKELGSPTVVDCTKAPRLTKLCGRDRRQTQRGPQATFAGGVLLEWRGFSEPYEIKVVDVASLGSPRAIVDHISVAGAKAAQALIEKIEAHVVAEGYDLERTCCVTLERWWLRQTWVTVPFFPNVVMVVSDCVCAFGPWSPPEEQADEPVTVRES